MIYLLVAIFSGYAIGAFRPKGWGAYALCVPASGVIYFLINVLVKPADGGSNVASTTVFVIAALIQSLVLMLGVYLARRKAKNDTYYT